MFYNSFCKMPGKCVFTKLWLMNNNYKDWLAKADHHRAQCIVHVKDFDIINTGEATVVSHMQGKKHQNLGARKWSAVL